MEKEFDSMKVAKHKCELCNKEFASEPNLRKHVKVSHEEGKNKSILKCEFCLKVFKTKESMKLHIKISHQESNRSFQCNVCDMTFDKKDKLFNHLAKHDRKKYMCKMCDQSLSTKNSLNNHHKSFHSDIPKLKCETCDTEFRTS